MRTEAGADEFEVWWTGGKVGVGVRIACWPATPFPGPDPLVVATIRIGFDLNVGAVGWILDLVEEAGGVGGA